jgi:hypothetical protein
MEPTLYIGITQSLFAGLVVITKKPGVRPLKYIILFLIQ